MDNKSIGKSLLDEVEEVEMDGLLRRLSNHTGAATRHEFMIDSLDDIVHEVKTLKTQGPVQQRSTHEAIADQDLSRNHEECSFQARLGSPAVVEFTSCTSGAGKTYFLYQITALNVLPAEVIGQKPIGKNATVVVIDLDNRFDVDTLVSVMLAYIRSQLGKQKSDSCEASDSEISSPELEEIVHQALNHVHIFRTQSLDSCLTTLESLEAYLLDPRAHQSSQRRLGAILLDGASAFYWQHRAEEDVERFEEGKWRSAQSSSMNNQPAYLQLLQVLKRVAETSACPVILTSESIFSPQNKRGERQQSTLRRLLPSRWQSYADACFLFERTKVVPFAPDMTSGEAWTERRLRQDVVERGRFRAQLVSNVLERSFEFLISNGCINLPEEQ